MLKDTIQKLTEEMIQDSDLYLVDVRSGTGKRSKITVLLDSDNGISIDQCAEVSRKLSLKLEELNLVDSPYTLEVSSPGLDEPLKIKRQYIKNRGRDLLVTLIDGSQKKGTLKEVTDDVITLQLYDKKKKEEQTFEIALKDIKKSNIIVSFK